MRKWAYLIFGCGLCVLFTYAGFTGWNVTDFGGAATWGAKGAAAFNHK